MYMCVYVCIYIYIYMYIHIYIYIYIYIERERERERDGNTMHRLAGVMYCKATGVYSKERIRNGLGTTIVQLAKIQNELGLGQLGTNLD